MEFSTHYELGDLGEVPLLVEFDYQRAEKKVLYPADKAEEGCAESAEITSVQLIGDNGKTEILELCSGDMLASLEDSAIEYLNDISEVIER